MLFKIAFMFSQQLLKLVMAVYFDTKKASMEFQCMSKVLRNTLPLKIVSLI